MDTGAAALSAAVLGSTTGAAAFNPLRQYSKMTPRAHTLTSKESYHSLTSVECKALQFPLREEKLPASAAAWASAVTIDGTDITDYQTITTTGKIGKTEPNGKVSVRDRLTCME